MPSRWPRFSLATLFVVIAVAAILLAYLRTLQDDSIQSTGHRSISSGGLSKADVDSAAKSLEVVLLCNGYSPSSSPPSISVGGHHEWYSRNFGVGETYVAISHSPIPKDGHQYSYTVLGRKHGWPLTDYSKLDEEYERIGTAIESWWKAEIDSAAFRTGNR
jgi:hypothetical protein